MFLHVRRRGEVSRRPCMLIKFCLTPSPGVCRALRCDYHDSRCHFACSSFAVHRLLAFAPPVRTASRDFGLRHGVLVCPRLRASLDEGIVRRRFSRSCRFLLSVVVAFPTRRRFIDGGRALRARSAEDRRKAIRKRIARTVVNDGHERARTVLRACLTVAICY